MRRNPYLNTQMLIANITEQSSKKHSLTDYYSTRLKHTYQMKEKRVIVDLFPINLGQLLKYADEVQDGLEAKILIQNGHVKVNGYVDTRRGRKLFVNDMIQIKDEVRILLLKKAGHE